MVGKLECLPLRTVWPHVTHAFTVWLTENTDRLDPFLKSA